QESGQVLAPVEGKPDYQALADTLHLNFTYKDSKICANSQLSGTTFKTFCLPYPLSGIL
ncbi:hypothetical protein ACUOFC_52120, partial [Escherichia sp. TWPC-MK]